MSEKKLVDLLLVNPGNRTQIYQSLGSNLAAIENPVWAGLIATFIRKRGFSVVILDANADNLTPEETADKIVEFKPLLTAMVAYGHNPSASTQVMPSARKILQALRHRNPTLKTILVGGHVASLPERTLREEPVDLVASGEGPYTLSDLLELLKSDQPDQYDKVRDLWYREGGVVRSTRPAPIVQDLDGEMPGIAWDLMPMQKYRAHNWHCFDNLEKRQPYASMYTTLGCPYHCSYCCIQAPFRSGERLLGIKEGVSSYRYWSPDRVMDQIDTLVNVYGVRNIKFADELFVLNNKHVHGICDQIIERGYDLNIWAYARVDSIRGEDTIEKLKKAGVNWLCFGIESANERVRDDVNKGYKQELIYKTVAQVREAGIYVIANYMFGLPEDDHETMQQTLDNSLELNCEFANFYSAMAYPGSQLYDAAMQEGLPLPADWSGYSQHAVNTLPLPTKHISGAEVLHFRDNAFQVYFNNPAYLEMIGQEFGPQTVQHIREMTAHQLARDAR